MKTLVLPLLLLLSSAQTGLAQSRGLKAVEAEIPIGTERRLALVLGNKEYTNIAPLQNPLNDAEDMAKALEEIGFEVIKATNTDYREMIGAMNRFKESLTRSDVALFYYSGHGVSYQSQNYLLPIDADISCLERIAEYGIPLNRILADIANQKVKNSFVFLDACRNVPNLKVCSSSTRDLAVNSGLVKPGVNPNGSMVVYATNEGSTADDNIGARNGLFTGALLNYLTKPNLDIRSILDLTSKDVLEASNGKQRPGRYDELLGKFYFLTAPDAVQADAFVPTQPAVDLEPVLMTRIEGGSFDMGSDNGELNEQPVRHVKVNSFRMGVYETSVAEFERFVEATSYITDAEKEGYSFVFVKDTHQERDNINWRHGADGQLQTDKSQPVVHVSHNDAMAYCLWLSRETKRVYRLPTEAEWEYAAGNGSKHTRFSWGADSLNADGNVADLTAKKDSVGIQFYNQYTDGYVHTAPVGKFKPNELGLYDMTGNVAEWCSDWYDYGQTDNDNPTGPMNGSDKVIKGGNWRSSPFQCRVSYREYNLPTFNCNYVGFRVVNQ
jgi:formylglycine-generating enzyme required for sulfatase activity